MGLPSGLYTFVGGATPAASDWNTNPTVFENILSGNVDQDNVTTSGSKGVLTIADTQTITGTKTFTVTNTSGIATFTSQSVHTGGLKSGSSIISDTTNTDTLGTSAVTWADLYLGDGAVAYFGEDQDVSLTHTADTGLHLNAGMKLGFRDLGGEYIYSVADGTLGIVAATEVDITTTTVDINGALDVSGNIVSGGEIDAVTLDISGNADIDGIANLDNTDIDGTLAVDGTTISLDATTSLNIDNSNTSNGITIGTATSGVPVSIGHTVSEVTVNDNLTISGDADIDGTTNLDAVDIDGAVQLDGTLTIGANDTGYDVILYGDTASANLTWDTSVDDLIWNGAARAVIPAGNLILGSTAVTTGTDIVTVGTIGTGTWQGTAIASAYLDSDTAHLSGTQTFSGAKTFSAAATIATGSTVGNLTLANGSITDSSGAISMGDENLSTTGTLAAGATTIGGTLDFNSGTIDLSTQTVDVTLNAAVDALNFDSNTLSIDATNNRVGIGEAAPGALLHLKKNNGSAAIRMEREDTSVASGNEIGGIIMTGGESSADTPVARIVTYADDTWTSSSSPTRIEFEVTPSGATADVLAMTLDSTGNLGIGTSAPAVPLEASLYQYEIIRASTTASTKAGWISTTQGTTVRTYFGHLDSVGGGLLTGGIANAGVVRGDAGLHLVGSSTATVGATITTAGNLGIGTVAPAQLLHLKGTAQPNFKLETTGDNHPHLMISGNRSAANVETGRLQFQWNGNAIATISSVSGPSTTPKNDGKLSFQTAATGGTLTERMRINELGNVGIGEAAPNEVLTVAGAVSITDGMTAPSATSGYAKLYVDTADGDLKVIFGDGTIKTLTTDT